ncbi:SseB family protein [Phycicoccus ginsengisoli]
MRRPSPAYPPVVYLPCADADATDGPAAAPRVEYRRTRDGRTAVVAYSALDRLLDGCGAQQPWTLMTLEQLDELQRREPFDLLLLDLAMPADQRRGASPAPRGLPPVLYLPCATDVTSLEDVEICFLQADDGSTGLPAFTSLDRLQAVLGVDQPWFLAETAKLETLRGAHPYDHLLVDDELAVHGRGEGSLHVRS